MTRAGQAVALLLLLTHPAGVRTQHYSWWSDDPRPYLDAIRRSAPAAPLKLAPGETIRAGIVTHHFLASGLMVRFFQTLRAGASPETIILIGPNHYHHGSANISFSSLPWKTPFGELAADTAMVRQIETATHLAEDSEAFAGEHSIGVLVPFVKHYFPACRIVPVLVDINARPEPLRALRGALTELLRNPRVLVVLSMDFSHDSTAGIAEVRDAQSQVAIGNLDLRAARDLNIDCPKGLWLLMASLRDRGGVRVQVSEHTNSARLTGNLKQPDVTSYFSIYFLSG